MAARVGATTRSRLHGIHLRRNRRRESHVREILHDTHQKTRKIRRREIPQKVNRHFNSGA